MIKLYQLLSFSLLLATQSHAMLCADAFTGDTISTPEFAEARLHPRRDPEVKIEFMRRGERTQLTWYTRKPLHVVHQQQEILASLFELHFPIQRVERERLGDGSIETVHETPQQLYVMSLTYSRNDVQPNWVEITFEMPTSEFMNSVARHCLRSYCGVTADASWSNAVPDLLTYLEELIGTYQPIKKISKS